MFCPNCGAQMPNEARFCGACGHQLTQEQAAFGAQFAGAQPQYQQAPQYDPQPQYQPGPQPVVPSRVTDGVGTFAKGMGSAAGKAAARAQSLGALAIARIVAPAIALVALLMKWVSAPILTQLSNYTQGLGVNVNSEVSYVDIMTHLSDVNALAKELDIQGYIVILEVLWVVAVVGVVLALVMAITSKGSSRGLYRTGLVFAILTTIVNIAMLGFFNDALKEQIRRSTWGYVSGDVFVLTMWPYAAIVACVVGLVLSLQRKTVRP